MTGRHTEDMTNTLTHSQDHDTYKHGALSVSRLLATSDGTRGRQGGLKQYIVRIELRANGKFLVTKHWGKADGQALSELASSVVGEYGSYQSAQYWAYDVVRGKLDGKYWHDYTTRIELV